MTNNYKATLVVLATALTLTISPLAHACIGDQAVSADPNGNARPSALYRAAGAEAARLEAMNRKQKAFPTAL